ncbi:uncharacterized protein K441DRAFT_660514 [Cenococcum geophilum 1.58]|uniref:uncharacterized protein n=1 Tax=Cenococcum geophilum 1.58 TaxID=794803 RepID=UPI00358E9ADF|nr:hypothetical protein K441DRAFT_660514 [Cenococcum geophilum 1.58]
MRLHHIYSLSVRLKRREDLLCTAALRAHVERIPQARMAATDACPCRCCGQHVKSTPDIKMEIIESP